MPFGEEKTYKSFENHSHWTCSFKQTQKIGTWLTWRAFTMNKIIFVDAKFITTHSICFKCRNDDDEKGKCEILIDDSLSMRFNTIYQL